MANPDGCLLFMPKSQACITEFSTINISVSKREPYQAISFEGAVSVLRQFLANESPLKMMKNGFHFALKALFVFFHFFLDVLVMYKNGKIRKVRLSSKFMTPQQGKQAIAIHKCLRSEGNEIWPVNRI